MTSEWEHTATYSPEDNKLRIYPACRLDAADYEQARAVGFRWAGAQELFVAPAWTPAREDFALELCGEIGDEDTSLADRAEQRAERFNGYGGNRTADAEAAYAGVSAITDNIPLGQPILVGHHSENRARRDKAKIDAGMRRAVQMWDIAQYWTDRAAGAIRHAKYKERPEVRARRIKKLEAERRKCQRNHDRATHFIQKWDSLEMTHEIARHIANFDGIHARFSLDEYPRELPISQYEERMCLWSALGDSPELAIITPEQARELATDCHRRTVASADRWIAHTDNRLAYERAMLGEQGRLDLLDKPKRAPLPPMLNYLANFLETENEWHSGEIIRYRQVEATKAELRQVPSEYKGGRLATDGSHRFRIAMVRMLKRSGDNHGHEYVAVFLTDSKVHEVPIC